MPTKRSRISFGAATILSVLSFPPLCASESEQRPAAYEEPPVLKASDLLPTEMLSGPRYRVQEAVPTDGLLAWFTIDSDFGTLRAASPEMAKIRINEIGALEQLESFETSDLAKDGFKRSAKELGDNLSHLIDEPEETLKGVPDGIGRFFKRTYRAAKTGVQTVQDRRTGPEEGGAVVAGPGANLPGAPVEPEQAPPDMSTAEESARLAGKTTADIFGYSTQRREIAKQLRVDPYTSNPVLAKRLDEVAWSGFSGGLGVTALKALAPGSALVSVTSSASNWVWDTPPGDLRVWNEQTLLGLGADQDSVDRFLRHPWYTLTLRTRLVKSLNALQGVADRNSILPLALSVTSFDQARFVVESTEMLSEIHGSIVPIGRLTADPTVAGWTANGLIVPAPVDAMSWTPMLYNFAHRPDLSVVERTIYIRGGATELAQTQLAALGWRLRPWTGALDTGAETR
ncbi:MAG: hypothetical protein U9Q81_10595 [Pseudomonadota bacterium]|nr:hypothetical protein [Pseudomonadota bacterium]